MPSTASSLDLLDRSLAAVGDLIDAVRPDQWSSPTPCTVWDVHRVVTHVVGMNRVFAALLTDGPPPTRGADGPSDELPREYRASATELLAAFARPGVMTRSYDSPMGSASGADRLLIRLYDLLAHGWDIATATAQTADLPEDAADVALAFVRRQLTDEARPGRFGPARQPPQNASAIENLVAFLGRTVT